MVAEFAAIVQLDAAAGDLLQDEECEIALRLLVGHLTLGSMPFDDVHVMIQAIKLCCAASAS